MVRSSGGDFLLYRSVRRWMCRDREGAQLAFFAVGVLDPTVLNELAEKFLGEILGILGGMAATPDIGIKREPVDLADFLQCVFGLRR